MEWFTLPLPWYCTDDPISRLESESIKCTPLLVATSLSASLLFYETLLSVTSEITIPIGTMGKGRAKGKGIGGVQPLPGTHPRSLCP